MLRVDLDSIFRRIDADERTDAMREIGVATETVVRRLWEDCALGPAPDDLHQLVAGCRDHFEHETLITSFSTIVHNVRAGSLKVPTIEALTSTLAALTLALSTIRSDRWGTELLAPHLRRSAQFLTGLLNEAGWLIGSQLAPRPDVVYLLFEKPVNEGKRYLELLVGEDPATVGALEKESIGPIIPTADVPTSTRFLVVDESPLAAPLDPRLVTLQDFVSRFTGLVPATNTARNPAERQSPSMDARRAMAQGATNLFLYGGPGTGKTYALRDLAAHGWPECPPFRFYVDFADADPGHADDHLDGELRKHFPLASRDHARGLASFLVRSGQAALLVDSVELLANAAFPKQAANAFARLCLFLSHESTVVLAGRDAAIRDAPAIRDFLMATPSASDQLAQVMKIRGVDSASLPHFRMIRARLRSGVASATTRRDRLVEALCLGISADQEQLAADRIRAALGDGMTLDEAMSLPPLPPGVVASVAVGAVPASEADLGFRAEWCTDIAADRRLLEFRAALDFVQAVISGQISRWVDVQLGEGARRFIRLLSVMLGIGDWPNTDMSLVGPPGAVFAVSHAKAMTMTSKPVTVAEYRCFLADLPRWLPTVGIEFADHTDRIPPLAERLPQGYFTDPEHGEYPATAVSWWGASAYAKWCGTRLPTSLEWEIVGRSWDGRIFPWGDDPRTERINCAETLAGHPLVDYSAWRAAMRRNEVATANAMPSSDRTLNISTTGCVDLVGNVWEWTATTVGRFRVIAGGAYDNPLRACTLSSRSTYRPDGQSNAVGFRVVAV